MPFIPTASEIASVTFDTTLPSAQAFGDAGSVGTAAAAAHRDHKHPMMANPVGISWTVVTKAVDESVASSTTLQADDELFFTPVSGGIYEIEINLIYASPDGGATPDIRANFYEDATTRGHAVWAGLATNEIAAVNARIGNNSVVQLAGTAATKRSLVAEGTYWGSGAQASIFWAQNTSDANPTIVYAGSTLRYRRIL